MECNIESGILEKSQLLRATIVFQWIYTLGGLQVPPLLYGLQGFFCKQRIIYIIWICFVLYTIILIFVVIWMVYVNNVVVVIIVDTWDLDGITRVLSISQNVAVAFVQVIMHLSAFRGYNVLHKIHCHVAQLEKDIRCYYKEYEYNCNMTGRKTFSQRCSSFRKRLLKGPLIFLILHSFCLCYVNYPLVSNMMPVRDRFLTILSFQIIQTKCSEYCLHLQVIDELLRALQESLYQLRYDIARGRNAKGEDSAFYRKLMANQFLLSRIWCLVKNIEDYFALPMLILFLYNGVAITHTINWSYVQSFRYDCGGSCHQYRLWFMVLVFINMLWTSWQSQNCIDKFTRMSTLLHDLKLKSKDYALRQRLREYSLQLMHQKMRFTCGGFFDINLKSFGLMMLSITTYVVILIQFKLQAETEKSKIRL